METKPIGRRIGDEAMSVIIARHGLWLDSHYRWGVIPHLFPHWQAGDALSLMMGCSDKPTGYAVVKPGVVDLDAVKIEAI